MAAIPRVGEGEAPRRRPTGAMVPPRTGTPPPRVSPVPARGRVNPLASGAATGFGREATTPRPLPSGWGVVRRRISRTMVVAVALLAVASAGVFQVLQSSRVAEVGYTLRDLEEQRESLDAQTRLLEARIAGSSNLDHLREQAVNRLGMVPAEQSMRIGVDTPAPQVVPLPRRYVHFPEHEPADKASWWEELIGSLPGFQ